MFVHTAMWCTGGLQLYANNRLAKETRAQSGEPNEEQVGLQ